jgi:hypothetical protein
VREGGGEQASAVARIPTANRVAFATVASLPALSPETSRGASRRPLFRCKQSAARAFWMKEVHVKRVTEKAGTRVSKSD